VLSDRDADSPRHFFLEVEFNALGYNFLQQKHVEQAIAMFRINTELYPESWNVYDSLGEALMVSGDRDAAIRMYEKSLEINPENANGQQMLERMRSAVSVK
jgi:tetratricopeptide (TPR) repeat protein